MRFFGAVCALLFLFSVSTATAAAIKLRAVRNFAAQSIAFSQLLLIVPIMHVMPVLASVSGEAPAVSVLSAAVVSDPKLVIDQQLREQKRLLDIQERERLTENEKAIKEVSEIVPSRKTVIAGPSADEYKVSADDSTVTTVLKLIPSYKYFKIIAKEYSSRSTSYVEGKEDLLAPFL